MKLTALILVVALMLASCTNPFAPPDAGETAVAMHAASFASDNSTMEQRQERFHRMQSRMASRNPQYNPYR